MKTEVFISHASADRVWANALCAHLEARRIRCWIAPRDVPPGGIWAEAIVDGIENTRVLVLLLSAQANASRQVINEVERAVSKGVVVLPVRLEHVRPSKGLEYFLSSRHWLEAVTPPVEQRIVEIGNQIERVLGNNDAPPLPPVPHATSRSTWAFAVAAALVVLAGVGVWWWTQPPSTTTTAAGDIVAPVRETSTTPASPPAVDPSAPAPRPASTPAAPPSTSPAVEPGTRDETTTPGPEIVAPAPAARTVAPPAPVPVRPTREIVTVPVATPTVLDVVLPDTNWFGVLEDSAGVRSTCLAQVERRTGDRVTVVVYFPEENGTTALRWAGRLTSAALLLEGIDGNRQRVSLSGALSGGQLTGTWTNDGGRRGTFTFDPNTGTAPDLVAGSTWRGALTVEPGDAVELTLRVIIRQDERITGRYAAVGQRGETAFSALVLGDRVFGVLSNLPVPGTQSVHARFLATVRDNEISGTWNSDAGLAGKARWKLEP